MSRQNFKILVCITPQTNGKHLIDMGHILAQEQEAELHILHVEKGDSIFMTHDAPQLLEKLFRYGSGLNGIIHGICGMDISEAICDFIRQNQITTVVLGAPPPDIPAATVSIHAKLLAALPHVNVIIGTAK